MIAAVVMAGYWLKRGIRLCKAVAVFDVGDLPSQRVYVLLLYPQPLALTSLSCILYVYVSRFLISQRIGAHVRPYRASSAYNMPTYRPRGLLCLCPSVSKWYEARRACACRGANESPHVAHTRHTHVRPLLYVIQVAGRRDKRYNTTIITITISYTLYYHYCYDLCVYIYPQPHSLSCGLYITVTVLEISRIGARTPRCFFRTLLADQTRPDRELRG